jgi:hypothetical protein
LGKWRSGRSGEVEEVKVEESGSGRSREVDR